MSRLFSYKLTNDSGFAPNPFWNDLTLATCKPQIRLKKRVDDWLAGFTSGMLNGDPVGQERLIYLARVSQKLTIANYFRAPEFELKKPVPDSADTRLRLGDNIYEPLITLAAEARDFRQLPNESHWDGGRRSADSCAPGPSQKHDVSGRFVLIAREFAYFGAEPLPIPRHLRPDIPRGQSAHGRETKDLARALAFIQYVKGQASGKRLVCHPWAWDVDDDSWKAKKACGGRRAPLNPAFKKRKGGCPT